MEGFNNYYQQQTQEKKATTKAEFLNLPGNAKCKKEIKGSAIICYICAVITGAAAVAGSNPFMFIDVAVLLVLGLFIQLKSSRLAAVLLLAYAIFCMIYSIAVTGSAGGYLGVIAGGFATVYTFKLEKAWKAYIG